MQRVTLFKNIFRFLAEFFPRLREFLDLRDIERANDVEARLLLKFPEAHLFDVVG